MSPAPDIHKCGRTNWVSIKMYINARDAKVEQHEQNHTIVFSENQEARNNKYIEKWDSGVKNIQHKFC